MRALAVVPGTRGSARLIDFPELQFDPVRELHVELLGVGICGTDREILEGNYGEAPPGEVNLVLGHESLGRVLSAPQGCGFARGDHVVAIVRHPDPVPCANCAAGEWDMCRNGRYTEHGIKGLHGFLRERYTLDPAHAVKVDRELGDLGVLLEPASILAKAWEHVEKIGSRALFRPHRVLVMGAGPVGLLGALMGRQRNHEVYVLDLPGEALKAELVAKLGATFVSSLGAFDGQLSGFDVILECTGVPALVIEAMRRIGPGGVACLAGVSSGGRLIQLDAGAWNREIVLENGAVFGSVNANRRHYQLAALSLASAQRSWLSRLVTGRVPLSRWHEAFEKGAGTIKTIVGGSS